METLREVLEKYSLLDQSGSLITDNGAENHGELKKWLIATAGQWKQLIAQVDILQSNSMVEAANKLLKYRYLFPKPIIDTTELTQTIQQALESYNNMRTASRRMPSFTD